MCDSGASFARGSSVVLSSPTTAENGRVIRRKQLALAGGGPSCKDCGSDGGKQRFGSHSWIGLALDRGGRAERRGLEGVRQVHWFDEAGAQRMSTGGRNRFA